MAQQQSEDKVPVVYVKQGGEITEEDLAKVTGGLPVAGRRNSHTINVEKQYCDVDCGF
jgi:hypothetical protein